MVFYSYVNLPEISVLSLGWNIPGFASFLTGSDFVCALTQFFAFTPGET